MVEDLGGVGSGWVRVMEVVDVKSQNEVAIGKTSYDDVVQEKIWADVPAAAWLITALCRFQYGVAKVFECRSSGHALIVRSFLVSSVFQS